MKACISFELEKLLYDPVERERLIAPIRVKAPSSEELKKFHEVAQQLVKAVKAFAANTVGPVGPEAGEISLRRGHGRNRRNLSGHGLLKAKSRPVKSK